YIVYFLQAMQQLMTDTGRVVIELPNGQKVTLDIIKMMNEAISKIISGGDYATKTEVNSKLAKDQNGADIPNKDTFIKNLGLGEKFQEKGNYADGTKYTSISTQCSIKASDMYGLLIQSSGVTGVWSNEIDNWTWCFSPKGTLTAGAVPFERLTGVTADANGFVRTGSVTALIRDDVVQVAGSATLKVMSQKAVTDAIASHGLGYGQKVTDVTASRVPGTVYTNSTLKPIFVNIVHMAPHSNISGSFSVYLDDVVVARSTKSDVTHTMSFIVPAGAKYRVEDTINTGIAYWSELR
ncbi:TPA: hypothetical protein ACPZ0L_003460, partial [Morganella morganii]